MKKYALKLIIAAIPLAMIWWIVAFYTPILANMETAQQRFEFALGCCALAGFLCLALGVEAVARDRLFSPAIDPLAGFETKRLKVNQQYLRNTLEQFVLFAFGILSLTSFLQNGSDMRFLLAITAVWIASRYIFWIAYHKDSLDRIYGLVGMVQSLAVLGLSVFLFLEKTFGLFAAALAIATFSLVEVVITLRSAQAGKVSPKKFI